MMLTTLLATCAILAAPNEGLIAFVTGETQPTSRLHVFDLATGDIQAIGAGQADGAPVWSPNGEWIAYPSNQDGARVIRLVKPDGSDERIVAGESEWNVYPSWSDDSRKLAFASGLLPDEQRILVYEMGRERLDVWGGNEAVGLTQPVWLGERTLGAILGAAEALGLADELNIDAVAMDVLRRGMILAPQYRPTDKGFTTEFAFVTSKQLLPPLFEYVMPSQGDYVEWQPFPSPEGREIAFESNDGGDREIFVLSFERGVFDVSNHFTADWNPVWAPDSRSLAFESFRSGRRGIYRVYPDTVRVTPIAVSQEADNWAPSWSPDGEWVVFVSNRTGRPQLWIADESGGDAELLVNRVGFATAPAWQPQPEEE